VSTEYVRMSMSGSCCMFWSTNQKSCRFFGLHSSCYYWQYRVRSKICFSCSS